MPLVLTRKENSQVIVHTPSGEVSITVTKIQRNAQVRLGIQCPREWRITRWDEDGNLEKDFKDWNVETDAPIYQYNMEELQGKNLEMFVGVDKAENPSRTMRVLMGRDKHSGKVYVINEEVVSE